MQRFLKTLSANKSNILSWKSKELSDKSIKPPTTYNEILDLSADFVGAKARLKFNGDCLKQKKFTFNYGKIVNIYIVIN